MYSAVIVGAGPVGCLTALGLAKQGWQVTLVEKLACLEGEIPASYDNRQLALTQANVAWLLEQSLLPELSAYLTPILRIHTSAQDGFGVMEMSAEEQGVSALGYTLAMDQLGHLLFATIAKFPNIQFYDDVNLLSLTQEENTVKVQAVCRDEQVGWQADYLFAGDGVNSWVRSVLGIGQSRHDYDHGLMTAVATLQTPHHHLAIERFTADGPTALLPMAGTHLAKVVLSYPLADKAQIQAESLVTLAEKINHNLGKQLGRVVAIHDVRHYLAMDARPDRIVEQRVLLLGNAAHTQHPVAGQGLNLGIRDVIALLAWSSEPDVSQLSALAQVRQQDHQRVMRFTSGLNHLFTHPSAFVRRASGFGIGLLQACTPLKKLVTRVAMGSSH